VFSRLQQILALFSLLLFLQAVLPTIAFSSDSAATQTPSAGQNANPLAEEEDEHPDLKLKFLCEEQNLVPALARFTLPSGSEVIPPGHILEIPTPPPLI
jgi:hypothetical protein